MRHSATRALMERDDVIIVASVSCIYGIGPLENYQKMTFRLHKGQKIDRTTLLRRFVEQQYKRNDNAFQRGTFRVRGDTIDLFPAHYEDKAWRFEMFGDEIESITEFDPLTGEKTVDAVRHHRLRQQPLRDAQAHDAEGDRADQDRPQAAARRVQSRRPTARGAAAGAAHACSTSR